MDRDALPEKRSQEEVDTEPDQDLVNVIKFSDGPTRIEPHHNCSAKELLESADYYEGDVVFYILSEDKEDFIGSIKYFFNEADWKGETDTIRGEVEFNSELLELLYTHEEFAQLINEVGTQYMTASTQDYTVDLNIIDGFNHDLLPKTLNRTIELAEFFKSRISDKKDVDSFKKFAESYDQPL